MKDFGQSNNCGSSLAEGSSCTVTITFSPVAGGTRTATFAVVPPQYLPIVATTSLTGTGTALAPAATIAPTTLNFGNQAVGTSSAAQTVTITNNGTSSLTFGSSGIAISSPAPQEFSQTNTCGTTLAVNQSCTVSVTFSPVVSGANNVYLVFSDNAPNSPQSVSLLGTGTAPATSMSVSTLAFGNQTVGSTSSSQAVNITNVGNATLSFGTAGISVGGANAGDFAETTGCGSSLAPGSSCTVVVTFSPTTQGSRSGSLSFADNAAGSPQQVALSGSGVAADVGATVTGPSSVRQGSTFTYTIGALNNGPGGAAGIKVSDVLPVGMTFRSTSGTGCTKPAVGTNGTVTCSIGSLPTGASATFTVTVALSSTRNTSLINTAKVSSTTLDTNGANDSTSLSTLITKH